MFILQKSLSHTNAPTLRKTAQTLLFSFIFGLVVGELREETAVKITSTKQMYSHVKLK